MRREWISVPVLTAGLVILTSLATRSDDGGRRKFMAALDGYQEVPSLSSPASGKLEVRIENDGMVSYELTYSGFQTAVSVSHIHLGRPGTTGSPIAFLCGGGTKPAACPQGSGMVSGTITPADIVGPAAQGIGVGEFTKFLDALRAEATYVNVHSAAFPGGEIRGVLEH